MSSKNSALYDTEILTCQAIITQKFISSGEIYADLITVIITTYKREPFMLKRAIESVIAQTYSNWELIIVDDSPEDYEFRDKVRDMVMSFKGRIKYVRHEKNSGVSVARNTGIKFAQGEYLAFLDDDDEWLPEKLERQIEKFNNPEIGLVYCRNYYVDDATGKTHEVKKVCHEGKVFDALLRENFIGSPSFVILRKEYLRNVGGFVKDASPCEDWDMWIRFAEHYRISCVDAPLVKYHDNHGEHHDTILRRIKGQEYIYEKYAEYFNHYVKCKRLSALSVLNRKAGNYRKALIYWLKSLPLQPFRLWTHIKEFL